MPFSPPLFFFFSSAFAGIESIELARFDFGDWLFTKIELIHNGVLYSFPCPCGMGVGTNYPWYLQLQRIFLLFSLIFFCMFRFPVYFVIFLVLCSELIDSAFP